MISKRKVPPQGDPSSSILLIGEAPGQEEDDALEPFVGRSGQFLDHALSLSGLSRDNLHIRNVCNYRPDRNDFDLLKGSTQLQEGYDELNDYFSSYSPRIVIALGNEALRYLKGHPGISNWRGSVLPFRNNSFIIPTYHPAAALRDGTLAPQIVHDITRAIKVFNHGYTPPIHDFIIDPDRRQFDELLAEIRDLSFICGDIETAIDSTYIKCMGFSLSRTRAFTIRNNSTDGLDSSFQNALDRIQESCSNIVFHNGGFDCQQLEINGLDFWDHFQYDTMLCQRAIEPQLPIGLDYCASIYTDEPFYKTEGKQSGKRVPWSKLAPYNCTDCIVTHATKEAQNLICNSNPLISSERDFIFSRIPLMRELQSTGLLLDVDRRDAILKKISSELQVSEWIIKETVGATLNFRSHQQQKQLLYDHMKLPHRTDYKTKKLTSDEDAVVSLIQYVQGEIDSKKTEKGKAPWKLKLMALRAFLDIKGHEKLISSYLNAKTRPDGRIHSSYYPGGANTGRWSSGLFVDGSGFNTQTMPRLDKIEIEVRDD